MANIKFMLRGRGDTKTIHVRLYLGRDIDVQCTTGLLIDPQKWDKYLGRYHRGSNYPDFLVNQNRIDKLRTHIIDHYNKALVDGVPITHTWLSLIVGGYFKAPKGSKAILKDLSSFCLWWLENRSSSWRTGKGKTMNEKDSNQYKNTSLLWKEFEGKRNLLLSDVGSSLISEFSDFLEVQKNYGGATAKRMVGRIKFFLARAEMEGLDVKTNYKERIYVSSKEEPLKPYLNVDEIDKIFNLDLSHDYKLDNIRDCMIIGLWTGLRISDFNKNLDLENIEDGYISLKTQKTGAWIKIPLHNQVQAVLKKRHGLLPKRYNNSYFNAEIKKVCMVAEIDQEIYGKKYCGETKRSVLGNYKKYELVTSHTCRRSFASNLYGRIQNHVLADLGGWSNEKTMIKYVKRTKDESAEVLKNYWNEKTK